MNENMKPILFSTPMVQAILAGRKTMTRRVIKPQLPHVIYAPRYPRLNEKGNWYFAAENKSSTWDGMVVTEKKPPYQVGDILWVRETWRICPSGIFCFKAIGDCDTCNTTGENTFNIKWRPSIHMPKEAARLFLRVTEVRVDRVQGITSKDALAEGFLPGERASETDAFHNTWDAIYGNWSENPWVWVIKFERTEAPK